MPFGREIFFDMIKSLKKQFLNIFLVVILAVIAFMLVKSSNEELNFATIGEFFGSCNLWYIALAVVSMLLFILFEALSLHVILKDFGHKPKLHQSIAYSTSDVYYSGITPSATGGQPASAFYMIRDGVPGGTACFGLIFNLIGYTAALIIIGIVVMVFNIPMFMSFSLPVKLLTAGGLLIQGFLMIFFIICIAKQAIVMKVGMFFIRLLHVIKLLKKKEKWQNKLEGVVEKYASCYECFKTQKLLFVKVLIFNILQRAALIGVSVFVCMSAIDCSVGKVFAMQTFVMLGYNFVPLPGGTGVFEYLYMNIYDSIFGAEFIVIAMMVTRVISYYVSMAISGVYTLVYHVVGSKKDRDDVPSEITENEDGQ